MSKIKANDKEGNSNVSMSKTKAKDQKGEAFGQAFGKRVIRIRINMT